MGSPLGPTLANAFLSFYEKKWLEKCPLNLNQFFIKDILDFKGNFPKRWLSKVMYR